MQTTPILTIEAAGQLMSALDSFLDRSEADFVVVIDRGGTILSINGDVPKGTDVNVVAALAVGSFAAVGELATRVGEKEYNALYQQGVRSHILMSAVDEDVVMVSVFGPKTTLGLVRFYSAGAVKQVAAILQALRAAPAQAPRFTEADLQGVTQVFQQ